jgi:hypothetical protein
MLSPGYPGATTLAKSRRIPEPVKTSGVLRRIANSIDALG